MWHFCVGWIRPREDTFARLDLWGYVALHTWNADSAHLLLLAGIDLEALIRAALTTTTVGGAVVVAAASRELLTDGGSARSVAQELKRAGTNIRAIAPAESVAGAWLRSRATAWSAVDVSSKASRLDRVWLPSALVESPAVVAVNQLRPAGHTAVPISIGMWATFAHPRQRTGARLSNDRDGLTAEVALAIKPALILISAEWNATPILLAANDVIAAEVAGLALLQRLRSTDDEPIGPWEHPLVQRATELELGALTPGQISAERLWLGDQSSSLKRRFDDFSTDILARIGVNVEG